MPGGIVCPDFALFHEFHWKNVIFHANGTFLQMRGQIIRFNKKKCFKILLEIGRNYNDGRGFFNLACFRPRGKPDVSTA